MSSKTMALMKLTPSRMLPDAVVLAFVFVIAAFHLKRRRTTHLPLPPGPPGHWLWGTHVPLKRTAEFFAQLTDEYGPVSYFRRGSTGYVVIGRMQAAMDILEKEGGSTADRPRSVAAGEMLSGNLRTLFVGAGDRLRRLRRAMHSHLQLKVSSTYEPLQEFNGRVLLRDILEDPEHHNQHARRYAGSVILSITYGQPSPSVPNDPEVAMVHICLKRLVQISKVGAYIVEQFPCLKYVPFYGREIRKYHQEELALFTGQVQWTRDQVAVGKAGSSFLQYLLERQDEHKLSNDEMAYLAGSLFGAGAETTAGAIDVVTMAAATHRELQAKAQAELDMVVGHDRLPTFGDWDMLPYVSAFALESMRWRPGNNSGQPHRATKDVIWNDYCIPAGTTIFGNHLAISRDPDVFPDGEKFIPERWLDENGRINKKMKFPAFGFGRRICPGQHVANRSIFINTAYILWSFRIMEDPTRPIDTEAFVDGFLSMPLPFAAQFTPRQPKLRELLDAVD